MFIIKNISIKYNNNRKNIGFFIDMGKFLCYSQYIINFQSFHQRHKRHPYSCLFAAIFHCEVSGKVCRLRILSNEGLMASGEILQAAVIPSAPFLFTQDEYIEIRKMWKSCLDLQRMVRRLFRCVYHMRCKVNSKRQKFQNFKVTAENH